MIFFLVSCFKHCVFWQLFARHNVNFRYRNKFCQHYIENLEYFMQCFSLFFIQQILCKWFYRFNGLVPSYLRELLVPNQPTSSLGCEDAGLLVVLRVCKSRRAFSCQAPVLWNHLPVSIWRKATLFTFKRIHKTFLCDETNSQRWLQI